MSCPQQNCPSRRFKQQRPHHSGLIFECSTTTQYTERHDLHNSDLRQIRQNTRAYAQSCPCLICLLRSSETFALTRGVRERTAAESRQYLQNLYRMNKTISRRRDHTQICTHQLKRQNSFSRGVAWSLHRHFATCLTTYSRFCTIIFTLWPNE